MKQSVILKLSMLFTAVFISNSSVYADDCTQENSMNAAVKAAKVIDRFNGIRRSGAKYVAVKYQKDGSGPASTVTVEIQYEQSSPGGNQQFTVDLNGACQVFKFEQLPVLE